MDLQIFYTLFVFGLNVQVSWVKLPQWNGPFSKNLYPMSKTRMLLSKILPQTSKKFTQIYLPYLWHYATLQNHFVFCHWCTCSSGENYKYDLTSQKELLALTFLKKCANKKWCFAIKEHRCATSILNILFFFFSQKDIIYFQDISHSPIFNWFNTTQLTIIDTG